MDYDGTAAKGPRRGKSAYQRNIEDAQSLLRNLESRTLNHQHVPITELRDILRRAAALLCQVKSDQTLIVHHLVGIPFAVFTKQAVKLGISLWMSVIKESVRMESRILVSVAEFWEHSVRTKQGLFSDVLRHLDPFYIKPEFAPSDKQATVRRQQQAYDTIAPHFRLLQFLSSHFSATRLSNPDVEQIYARLLSLTLDCMGVGCPHPLAREAYFHVLLLGLRVVQLCTSLSKPILWRLKDKVLSAGLSWFAKAPW